MGRSWSGNPEYKAVTASVLASFRARCAAIGQELQVGAAEKLGYRPGCAPASFVQVDTKNNRRNEVEKIAATCAQGVTVEAEAMSRGRRKSLGKPIVQGQTDEPNAARAVA
ncbi:hypothetical protein EJ07DRAFT_155711 [Lizonia empirigonia]|nr:hypothetical protein EJ07DRAFT_155711 [Lizonia empirigonia]